MRKAVVQGLFDPFTQKDLTLIRQYMKKHPQTIVEVFVNDGPFYKERVEIVKRTIQPYRHIRITDVFPAEVVEIEGLDTGLSRLDFTEVSDASAQYMIKKGMYFDQLAKKTLSEYRYYHVSCVARLSAELAEHYGLGYNLGLVAGYLHDITKEWDKEKQARFTQIYRPDKVYQSPKVYHQYTAKVAARTLFRVRDQRILDAVGNHVNGTDRKLLSRIVFCSDKIDDSRPFDNTAQKALCFRDINEGYRQIKEEQMAYLKEKKLNG